MIVWPANDRNIDLDNNVFI